MGPKKVQGACGSRTRLYVNAGSQGSDHISMCVIEYSKSINHKDKSLPREQVFVSREDAKEMAE